MTKSLGVSLAVSSILSTSAWLVGTQTTSLPDCPTLGSNGAAARCACATLNAAISARPDSGSARVNNAYNFMLFSRG